MGEQSGDFFRRLSSGPPRQWGAGARKILLLRERYATEALDAALGHAARFGALRFEDVQRVLEAVPVYERVLEGGEHGAFVRPPS